MKKILYGLIILGLQSCLIFADERSERDAQILARATAAGWKPNLYGPFTTDLPVSRDIGKRVIWSSVTAVSDPMKRWQDKTLPNAPKSRKRIDVDALQKHRSGVVAQTVMHGTGKTPVQPRVRRPLSPESVDALIKAREKQERVFNVFGKKQVPGRSGGVTTYDRDLSLSRTSHSPFKGFGYRSIVPASVDEIPRAVKPQKKDADLEHKRKAGGLSTRRRPTDCLVRYQEADKRQP